jgi:hypothetical protein
MAKVLSLMATHTGDGSLYNRSIANIDEQLSNIEENKEYAGTPFKRCVHAGMSYIKCVHTRRIPIHWVRTPSAHTSRQLSAHTWGFSWYLANGIVLSWFWPVVLFILLLLLSPMILDLRKSLPI